MSGFLPENLGVIVMDVIAEIRRRHFVEHETVMSLAAAFWIEKSSPSIIK